MSKSSITFISRERGDEGDETAFEHPQLIGRAANYAIALFESGAAGFQWRQQFAPDVRVGILREFAAAQITIGGDNMTPLDQRSPEGIDRFDLQRTFGILEINGRPGIWLAFDRRPSGSDDLGDFRRITLTPTAADAMRKLLGAGDSGTHASAISTKARILLEQVGVKTTPVDWRYPNSFLKLDPALEWRQVPPFTPAEAYAAPEPQRERELVIEHDIYFDHGLIKQGRRSFTGGTADAVAILIAGGVDGVHVSSLPANAAYFLISGCVPFDVNEDTHIARLTAPTPWRVVSDGKQKWGAAA